MLLFTLFTYMYYFFFVSSFCLAYLHLYFFYLLVQFALLVYLLSLTPKSTRLGFNHALSCVLQKELYAGHTFFRFGYIGWKPGRKFRSRIRMDGSAVCTRDTTPRTEMRLSVDPHLCRVWINFITIYLIAWFLSNVSLHLAWYWRGYPTSPTRAF